MSRDSDGSDSLTIDIDSFPDTQFPLPVFIGQTNTEAAMEGSLNGTEAFVERNVEVLSVKPRGDRVVAVLLDKRAGANPAETEVEARFVVGCDGAHGIVGQSANFDFHGASHGQEIIICDSFLNWGTNTRARINANRPSIGGCYETVSTIIPMRGGLFRIMGISNFKADPSTTEENNHLAVPSIHEVESIINSCVGPGVRVHLPFSRKRIRRHHRGATHYRRDRMFVAGDAAHIHSPFGGQGMNTGLQDAANLGWKLAHVTHVEREAEREGVALSDAARARLALILDSYHEERWPIGETLLSATDQLFEHALPPDLLDRVMLQPFFALMMKRAKLRIPSRQQAMWQFFTQLGVRYRKSPIVATGRGIAEHAPVRGGWRAPDGRIEPLNGGSTTEDERWLLTEAGATALHWLVVFVGGGKCSGEALRPLTRLTMRLLGSVHNYCDVIIVQKDPVGRIPGHIPDGLENLSWYSDSRGELHERWGFRSQRGFALVRPDGYVAYIGLLANWVEFIEWLYGRYPFATLDEQDESLREEIAGLRSGRLRKTAF